MTQPPATFLTFLVRRVAVAIVFVLAVSAGTFTLVRLAPGDATSDLVAVGTAPNIVAAERARLGLDRSLVSHLGLWLGGLARLDLGESAKYRRPVRDLVVRGAIGTAQLAAVALALATLVGLPLGLLTGARPGGWLSAVVTPVSVALVSCPPIVGALALLLIALRTGWLTTDAGSLAVPALAIGLPLAASLERVQSRATTEVLASPHLAASLERVQSRATTEVLASPHLLATAARGVPFARLLWVHVSRQSLRPVLGIYGLVIGSLFSGSLAVEWITEWPGLGRLTYEALTNRDLFLIAGCALAGAVLIAIGNLAADVVRGLADPRVRESL